MDLQANQPRATKVIMKTTRKNYLKNNKWHRLVFEKEDLLEICELFIEDFKKEFENLIKNGQSQVYDGDLEVSILFYNVDSSKELELKPTNFLKNKNEIIKLKDELIKFIDREDFCEIKISYSKFEFRGERKLINIIISSECEKSSAYASFYLESNNEDWVDSKIIKIESILKKTLQKDWFLILSAASVVALIALVSMVNFDRFLNIKSPSIKTLFFFIAGLSSGILAGKLINFIRVKCFPFVEFHFGKRIKFYNGNRRIFNLIFGTIFTAIIGTIFTSK